MEFCFSYATLFLVYLIWFFFFKFSYVLMSWRHWIFTAWIVYRYGIGQSGIHQMFFKFGLNERLLFELWNSLSDVYEPLQVVTDTPEARVKWSLPSFRILSQLMNSWNMLFPCTFLFICLFVCFLASCSMKPILTLDLESPVIKCCLVWGLWEVLVSYFKCCGSITASQNQTNVITNNCRNWPK